MELISKFSISHCLQNIAAGVENWGGYIHLLIVIGINYSENIQDFDDLKPIL